MKRYFLMAPLVATLAATSAWAQNAEPAGSSYGKSPDSMMQPADTSSAGAAGRRMDNGMQGGQVGKTRAEVKEELRRARESGELQRIRESHVGGR